MSENQLQEPEAACDKLVPQEKIKNKYPCLPTNSRREIVIHYMILTVR